MTTVPMKHLFSATLFVVLSTTASFAQGIDMDRDHPIHVVQGIVIEHHPQAHMQFKYPYTSPSDALVCDPADQRAACGKAFWHDEQLPLESLYYTSIPATIRLDGPSADVLFAPFARCIVTDRDGKRVSADAPGITCKTLLEHEGDYLRWAFGGEVYSGEELKSGDYSGSIPVTVTDEEHRWEFDMPITLDVKEHQAECVLDPSVVPPGFFDFSKLSVANATMDKVLILTGRTLPKNVLTYGGENVARPVVSATCTPKDTKITCTATVVGGNSVDLNGIIRHNLTAGVDYEYDVTIHFACP